MKIAQKSVSGICAKLLIVNDFSSNCLWESLSNIVLELFP